VLLARRIAACLLLALWLPALLHCRLEAAGLALGSECCNETHAPTAATKDSCADDACGVAEGEFTSPSSSTLVAPAPVLCTCWLAADILVPPLALAPPPAPSLDERLAAPPEISRRWMFVTRAAPAPRAPALA